MKNTEANIGGIYLTVFQRQMLQDNLEQELPNSYRQRLEIILLTDSGKTQAEICRLLGCSTTTASRWIHLTKVGLAHNYLDCPVGRPKIITDKYIEFLQELLQHSPRDYGYPFRTWTVSWLNKHISAEMGITVSESHLKRVMRELGLSTRSPKAVLRLSPAPFPQCGQPGVNIFIADLPNTFADNSAAAADGHPQEGESLELNLHQIRTDSRIYGSASPFTTYFSPTTRRDFPYFAYAC
jgi:transposase